MAMPGLVIWTFDGPPDEPNESPLPSPPPSTKSSPRGGNESDTDSDMEPDIFHDASPTLESGVNGISGPTPKSSLQKVEPPSTPPATPPGPPLIVSALNPQNASSGSRSQTKERDDDPPPVPPRPGHIGPTSAVLIQRILRGERHSAAFEGTSQYAAGGTSACGLASMNAIRLAFELCARMTDAEQLVSALISEEFVRAAMEIANHWPNAMHLEVEPILQLPIFSNSVQVLDAQYAQCTYRTFSNAVVALRLDEDSPGPRAVCLTRPPEVIGVMHIPIPKPGLTSSDWTPWTARRAESLYLIFDSHPRPNHPNGAAVQIFPARPTDDIAEYLMDLFQVDEEIMKDPNLEWTVQLFGQLSYHVLAPSPTPEAANEYRLNMQILEGNRKREWAEEKLKAAEAETRKLRTQVFELQQEISMLNFNNRRTKDEAQRLKEQLNRATPPPPKQEPRTSSWVSSGSRAGEGGKGKGKAREDSGGWQAGPAPKDEPTSRFPSWFSSHNTSAGESSKSAGQEGVNHGGSRANTGASKRTSGSSDFEFSPWSRGPSRPPQSYATTSSKASGSSGRHIPAIDEEEARSIELALKLQREFDDETAQVSRGESLAKAMERPKFDCGICMETFTDEAIARIDGCGHSCCRECMRSNIQSKIEDRRYPIPCPFCVVGSDDNDGRRRVVGTISPWIVETIGISSELFDIYTELQLAEHSIMIDCRGCSSSVFVDRKDYDRAEIITCPMPRCTRTWCKQCNQTIQGGSRHSCDGSAELETLMTQRGWKHCPGCRTPIERSMGCNHMTCTTPGCNMHFCYKCGQVVINGGTRNEIQAAVANHFRSCALFDVPTGI